MKKQKLIPFVLCGCLCLCMGNSANFSVKETVPIVIVNNLEEVSPTNPEFSLNTIFVSRNLQFGSGKQDAESNMNNVAVLSIDPADHQETSITVEAETIMMAKYFFSTENDVIGTGYLFGTQDTTITQFEEMISDTQNSISTGKIQQEASVAEAKLFNDINPLSSLEIGSDWKLALPKKITWSLDHGNKHYGDFSEWHNTYEFCDEDVRYLLVTHESYISPNSDGSRYRAKSLIYNATLDPIIVNDEEQIFDTAHVDSITLRDYGPKAKNPNETISYGFDFSLDLSSDSIEANVGFSSTYTTTRESPTISDQGNMANDIVKIVFDYLDYKKASGTFVDYCKNQTMQTATYLYQGDNTGSIIGNFKDDRTVSMYYRGDWPWTKITCDFHNPLSFAF